jgi:hypothetical protein
MVIHSVKSAVNDRLVFATNERQDTEKLKMTVRISKTVRLIPKREKRRKGGKNEKRRGTEKSKLSNKKRERVKKRY